MSLQNAHGILVGIHAEGGIYGWAEESSHSESARKVYIFADRQLLGIAEAQYRRPDRASHGESPELAGFGLIPPLQLLAKLRPGCPIHAYFDEQQTCELENSPIELDQTAIQRLLDRAQAIRQPNLVSYLEEIGSNGIVYGWAIDPYYPDETLSIYLYAETIPLGMVEAQLFREDLRQAGMGDGRRGFGFALGTRLDLLNKLHAGMPIHAYFDAERRYELAHSPVKLRWEVLESLLLANSPVEPLLTDQERAVRYGGLPSRPEEMSKHLKNIAPEGTALQSSLSEWSTENDAQGAINGIKTGKFGFHTGYEDFPWWRVDLGATRKVVAIALYNREDVGKERAKDLTMEYSSDGISYHKLCTTHFVFGGSLSNRPLFMQFEHPLDLRFFRITLDGTNHLHLDEVEIFVASQDGDLIINGGYYHSLDHLEEPIAMLLNDARFDDALISIYLGSEAEKNANLFEQWYLKMVDAATAAHKAGAYRPQTILFRSRWGGLCNRLYSLASAYSYSVVLGMDMHICWTPSIECPSVLHDLINTNPLTTLDVAASLELVRRNGGKVAWTGAFGMDHDLYRLLSCTRPQKERIDQLARSFIQTLDFSEIIRARVQEFMRSHEWDNSIVGVHVRSTDHTAHFTDRGRAHELSGDESFKIIINDLIAQGHGRFYLATDAIETFDKFHDWFGDRIFTRIKSYNTQQLRQTSIEDAIIDLILLSKTQKIIGSKLSTFSQFASLLGNTKLIFA